MNVKDVFNIFRQDNLVYDPQSGLDTPIFAEETKEVFMEKLAQLCYLDLPEKYRKALPLKLGKLCEYYLYTSKGRKFLMERFGNIETEYEYWRNFLQDIHSRYHDITIVYIYDDNNSNGTGLYACIFYTMEEEYVIAFRGSEMLGNSLHRNDYDNNFALSYMLETPQQLKTLGFIREYENRLTGDIYITGHSLGGNLALYTCVAASSLHDRLKGCYAYNAPGFSDDFVVAYAERILEVSSIIYNYQNKYDIISSIFNSLGNPIIISSNYSPFEQKASSAMKLFYPHSGFCYKVKDGEFVREKSQKKATYCHDVNRFTKRFLQMPISYRRDICKIILEVLYDPNKKGSVIVKMVDAITLYCNDKKNGIHLEAENDLLNVLGTAKYNCSDCTVGDALDQYRATMELPSWKRGDKFFGNGLIMRNLLEFLSSQKKVA